MPVTYLDEGEWGCGFDMGVLAFEVAQFRTPSGIDGVSGPIPERITKHMTHVQTFLRAIAQVVVFATAVVTDVPPYAEIFLAWSPSNESRPYFQR